MDIKLGPTEGEATILPPIRWIEGNAPELSVVKKKQIAESRMSDGSFRYAFFPESYKRQWVLGWGFISKQELDDIEILHNMAQILVFQNNFESSDWYNVIFVDFDYGPAIPMLLEIERYWCRITLKEA